MNFANQQIGATVVSSSSEVPGCDATNVLDEEISKIWLSEEGIPQWLCLSLLQLPNLKNVEIRTVGWYCWHSYSTNPKEVRLHVSRDGAKFRIWDTLTADRQRAGTQLFCTEPINASLYPYVAFEILSTFGGAQTYLNQIYLYSDEIANSFVGTAEPSRDFIDIQEQEEEEDDEDMKDQVDDDVSDDSLSFTDPPSAGRPQTGLLNSAVKALLSKDSNHSLPHRLPTSLFELPPRPPAAAKEPEVASLKKSHDTTMIADQLEKALGLTDDISISSIESASNHRQDQASPMTHLEGNTRVVDATSKHPAESRENKGISEIKGTEDSLGLLAVSSAALNAASPLPSITYDSLREAINRSANQTGSIHGATSMSKDSSLFSNNLMDKLELSDKIEKRLQTFEENFLSLLASFQHQQQLQQQQLQVQQSLQREEELKQQATTTRVMETHQQQSKTPLSPETPHESKSPLNNTSTTLASDDPLRSFLSATTPSPQRYTTKTHEAVQTEAEKVSVSVQADVHETHNKASPTKTRISREFASPNKKSSPPPAAIRVRSPPLTTNKRKIRSTLDKMLSEIHESSQVEDEGDDDDDHEEDEEIEAAELERPDHERGDLADVNDNDNEDEEAELFAYVQRQHRKATKLAETMHRQATSSKGNHNNRNHSKVTSMPKPSTSPRSSAEMNHNTISQGKKVSHDRPARQTSTQELHHHQKQSILSQDHHLGSEQSNGFSERFTTSTNLNPPSLPTVSSTNGLYPNYDRFVPPLPVLPITSTSSTSSTSHRFPTMTTSSFPDPFPLSHSRYPDNIPSNSHTKTTSHSSSRLNPINYPNTSSSHLHSGYRQQQHLHPERRTTTDTLSYERSNFLRPNDYDYHFNHGHDNDEDYPIPSQRLQNLLNTSNYRPSKPAVTTSEEVKIREKIIQESIRETVKQQALEALLKSSVRHHMHDRETTTTTSTSQKKKSTGSKTEKVDESEDFSSLVKSLHQAVMQKTIKEAQLRILREKTGK